MTDVQHLTQEIRAELRNSFKKQEVVLAYADFLNKVFEDPRRLTRNSAKYILDTFEYFGSYEDDSDQNRFKLFDFGRDQQTPIIGNHKVHKSIYLTLKNFVRQNGGNKLILLHGPNGSAKTSTVETIANAMNIYSQTDDGAVYTFNWIFPVGKDLTPRSAGESGPIGFSTASDIKDEGMSFAHLDEEQVASKIHSEYRENPIFLLPMPFRETFLKNAIAEKDGLNPDDITIPVTLLKPGLSKRNQLIFDNLMMAYEGDLVKVLRHIQVERFFYSKQYRVGISTIEPQLSLDAREAQLTMDKNIANLPSILHNIRFHEAQGQLVEANCGLLEFSDLFKRPLEAYKYLLTMIENHSLNLPSSTTYLDVVFIATSNEKHLDAFKTVPDFTSFRERFELITVPYLLQSQQEEKIYEKDIDALKDTIDVCPHSLEMLCNWAVMTRLKQPDPESFEKDYKPLINKLEPRDKVRLYNGEQLSESFTADESNRLNKNKNAVMEESDGMVVYEGRFGASPREVRSILHRASQINNSLTPMAVFKELKRICRDRTIYEFLQFEPRGKYHDVTQFIKDLEFEFADIFESEVSDSMEFVQEVSYGDLMSRYISHVLAFIKKEKLYDPVTESYITPSEKLMTDVETILKIKQGANDFRQSLINRIAAYKLDNKEKEVELKEVFRDLFKAVKEHYYEKQKATVKAILEDMLTLEKDEFKNLSSERQDKVKKTYEFLKGKFGYSQPAAHECVKFLLTIRKTGPKT